ncbi:HNH endonuclease [Actinocorallia sp. API 0066]|uniref:HNH endonuclease n=1 Tax=Actinocorallia sp. API 0066 TaxID=2896846 RepID=UPI001E3F6B68|nr:HNH endonuclease signature motif containing protein [Actinocorallia sp. API 0066]MCD0449456.1 HNH endonuclease [Actinocorallia sp. API 0066]
MAFVPVEWGFPVGFGVPVFGQEVALWPDWSRQELDGVARWSERPGSLATRYELGLDRLRPLNDLLLDGIAIGPHHQIEWNGESRLIYRPVPLYRRAHAVGARDVPTERQVAADRNHAINTARDLFRDPSTLIIAINTIGRFRPPKGNLDQRTAICEFAAIDLRGRTAANLLIDPEWKSMRGQRNLRRSGLTPKLVRSGNYFRDEPLIHETLNGRKVVCVDRAAVYGAFYSEQEFSTDYGPHPNGLLNAAITEILEPLSSISWECARVLRSLFEGIWFEPVIRPALAELPPPQRALDQAHGVLRILREIASAKKGPKAEPSLRQRSYPTQRRATFRQEFVRDPAKRSLVLHRSGGICENPDCGDKGYQLDRTVNDEPLLQVDHITPLGQRGEDEIINMIAVCGNCHERKTRGRNRASLEWLFHTTTLTNQQKLLRPPK